MEKVLRPESIVAARALEFVKDVARAMQESWTPPRSGRPRFRFEGAFRPDRYYRDETPTPSFDGAFVIECRGRGLAKYFPKKSFDRKLVGSGGARVVSLRLWPSLIEQDEACNHFEEILKKSASCLFVAPRLVPSTFREDVRRFMRDNLGNDDIRFFDTPILDGVTLEPWHVRRT